jgi:hypothetical protein
MERNQIMEMLEGKYWFVASPEEIRAALAALPPKWDGFLTDLAARADVLGGLRHERIVAFVTDPGKFGCIVTFEVNNLKEQKLQTYMYFSWRNGPISGAKGQVFIQNAEGEVTHFIRMRSEKFAIGGETVDDLPGGFGEPGEAVLQGFLREIKEEISPNIEIIRVEPLGQVHIDAGQTNNKPFLFFAVIQMDVQEGEIDGAQTDTVPIDQYQDFIANTSDNIALGVFAKMFSKGYWPL